MSVPPGRPAGVPSHPAADGDGWDGWPGWAFDLRLVTHYAPRVAAALTGLFDEGKVRAAVATYHHRHVLTVGLAPVAAVPAVTGVAKAKGDHPTPASGDANRYAARQFLADTLALDPAALLEVLRAIYGDAWIAGAHAAVTAAVDAGAAGAVVAGTFDSLDTVIAWDSWAPGWAEAAIKLAGDSPGSGLAALLNTAGHTIRGVTGHVLDNLGEALADGVARGASVESLTESVLAVIGGSSVRAETIAWTETARAMTLASLDTYSANGIQAWDWLISPGACPTCESEALANPHSLSDDAPPGHPRCRCCASPVVTVAPGSSSDAVEAAIDSGAGDPSM